MPPDDEADENYIFGWWFNTGGIPVVVSGAYVAEDGTSPYVAEDGASPYVTET